MSVIKKIGDLHLSMLRSGKNPIHHKLLIGGDIYRQLVQEEEAKERRKRNPRMLAFEKSVTVGKFVGSFFGSPAYISPDPTLLRLV